MTYLVTYPLLGGGHRTDLIKADRVDFDKQGAIVLWHRDTIVFCSKEWLRVEWSPVETMAGRWVESVSVAIPATEMMR